MAVAAAAKSRGEVATVKKIPRGFTSNVVAMRESAKNSPHGHSAPPENVDTATAVSSAAKLMPIAEPVGRPTNSFDA